MSKKHPLLLSSLLLALSFQVCAEEETGLPETLHQVIENSKTQSFSPFTGVITGSKVRMRASPTLEGHVVRETSQGDLFIVAGETNDYYSIVPPKDAKGFVFRTFILDGIVEGERVNVRLYPDMDAPVIGQLNTGDKVDATVSSINNKWLEIALPTNSRFYIAKEFIENKGPPELLVTIEKKRAEAAHTLSSALLFAQAEIQKPFEQIDLDQINEKFEQISKDYSECSKITVQAEEAASLIQDIYVQKKVAFLEGKAEHRSVSYEIPAGHVEKLAKLGINLSGDNKEVSEIGACAATTMGLFSSVSDSEITDKMLLWQPLEESLYHLWAAVNEEKSMDEFYAEEQQTATMLTGIVEPYNRPVKNRPGDFLLKSDNLPVAFLYSTRVNLEKFVGQKVALLAAPRPNHNFAFPAYFVISLE